MKGNDSLERDISGLIKTLNNGIDNEKELDNFVENLDSFLKKFSKKIKDDKQYKDFTQDVQNLTKLIEYYNNNIDENGSEYSEYSEYFDFIDDLMDITNSLENTWDDIEDGIKGIGEDIEDIFSDLFAVDDKDLPEYLNKKIQS